MAIELSLRDEEWEYDGVVLDREVARAIAFDDEGYLYFVRVKRNDEFGKADVIETSGGGVEANESPAEAVVRELKEELGAVVCVEEELGLVSDYYNLIRRHNVNRYFLCRIVGWQERSLTEQEQRDFHLSVCKLTAEQAVREYERNGGSKIGRLIKNRELPVLLYACERLRERGEFLSE